jgi:biopolymer transport protein ExbD
MCLIEGSTLHLHVTADARTTSHALPADADATTIARLLPRPRGPGGRASIGADRDVPYDRVVTLIDAASLAGWTNVVMQVAPAE